jgi:CMP-N-acetylneuraminic acid synthetase
MDELNSSSLSTALKVLTINEITNSFLQGTFKSAQKHTRAKLDEAFEKLSPEQQETLLAFARDKERKTRLPSMEEMVQHLSREQQESLLGFVRCKKRKTCILERTMWKGICDLIDIAALRRALPCPAAQPGCM